VQARQDVPMARAVQTTEELQLQSDQMQRIEQLKAMYVGQSVRVENLQLVSLFDPFSITLIWLKCHINTIVIKMA